MGKTYFPKLMYSIQYKHTYHKKCSIRNPQTFSEKLIWLAIYRYRNNKIIMELQDKYAVREYVSKKVGKEVLNELFFCTDRVEDINIERLPDKFALKLNQGWATNYFCKDKSKINRKEFFQSLHRWNKGQLAYDLNTAKIGGVKLKGIHKRYLCERLMLDCNGNFPIDYKFYCFNGEPMAILVISDRFSDKRGAFMSTEWNLISSLDYRYNRGTIEYVRPLSLEKMIKIAKALSQGFPFVRVDLYEFENRPIFGEMTFFPAGCIGMQETIIEGKTMGELLNINEFA